MNKEFLESLANYLENFISDEVEKRCKKLEDEKMPRNGIHNAIRDGCFFSSKITLSILINYMKKQKENPVNGKKVMLITEYLACLKGDLKPTIEHTCINVSKNSKNFMRTHNASSFRLFYLRRKTSKSSAERRLT